MRRRSGRTAAGLIAAHGAIVDLAADPAQGRTLLGMP